MGMISDEKYEEYTAYLDHVDVVWASLAQSKGVVSEKNSSQWPGRYYEWMSDGLHRQVEIYLETNESTFRIILTAWRIEGNQNAIKFILYKSGIKPPLDILTKKDAADIKKRVESIKTDQLSVDAEGLDEDS